MYRYMYRYISRHGYRYIHDRVFAGSETVRSTMHATRGARAGTRHARWRTPHAPGSVRHATRDAQHANVQCAPRKDTPCNFPQATCSMQPCNVRQSTRAAQHAACNNTPRNSQGLRGFRTKGLGPRDGQAAMGGDVHYALSLMASHEVPYPAQMWPE